MLAAPAQVTQGWSFALLAVAVSLFVLPAARAQAPRAPVADFESALIDAMKGSDSTSLGARRKSLGEMVDRSFDLPEISKAVIGRHWGGLSDGERQSLSRQIRDYAVAILTSRFSGYEGQRFEPQGESDMGSGYARVRSRFRSGPGDAPQLDYVVRRSGTHPRIVNVYFDGVSGTDIQRAEFEVFLRQGGVQVSIPKLEALIAAHGP